MKSYKQYVAEKVQHNKVYRGSSSADPLSYNKSENKGEHPSRHLGLFLSVNKDTAKHYAGNKGHVYDYTYDIKNPYKLDSLELSKIETEEEAKKLRNKLIKKGHDSIIVYGYDSPFPSEYIMFYPEKQLTLVNKETLSEFYYS